MTSRRGFLAGLLATGVAPAATWADVGAPAYLSAAQGADGAYYLLGVGPEGGIRFRQKIPGRGHAAAAHPQRAEAVGFARRPGTFAFVLDCLSGDTVAELSSPEGRHFYGHGVFSRDGALLFTAENDYDNARGVIGVWDVRAGYVRTGEFDSQGVGPHDVRLMPDGETLVVANGGIETHPDSGRTKLNIPVMQPNLTYLRQNGSVLETVELAPALHMNSIRHLDLRADGLVGFAMQWQGGQGTLPPILGVHQRGAAPRLFGADPEVAGQMNGYGGSVSFSGDGRHLAVSSPRGARVQVFDVASGALAQVLEMEDVCGLGAAPAGFLASAGTGQVAMLEADGRHPLGTADVRWDNHLVPLHT
ncbi:DUF1513 domain-containing protein [Pseudodonghicola flavimaris]|uniref:DUF1513 domain-containing protein n=1 Tax=Pseudodonghicola flavimaris TaxID=3050036 RepID=A0ABT7F4F5_9RHOB|nr:DUF1513 domain-containing protein [Pseudodonghicola flavimaris]MDK3019485.1 DUF1513 domain-containing protein [Pseudodonghicola flavimaris]